MSYNTYDNPQSVTIGSTSITGVTSISISEELSPIVVAADDDTVTGIARYSATHRVSGTITLVDPIVADTVVGATGTLAFTVRQVNGSTNKTCTLANASVGGSNANISRDSAAGVTLPFMAEAAPSWA